MALHMNWTNTPRYQHLTKMQDSEAHRDEFETIGFALLGTDMGPELREQDVYEFWARCQVMSGIAEFSHTQDAFRAITRETIRGMVGFRINAGRSSRASWIKRQMDGAIMTAQYLDRQSARQEATDAGK